jgi:acyl-CoA thioesterase FadM
VTSVGDDHFTMEYAALSREQGKIVAVGEALVVMYNYLERRPSLLSKDLHAAIVALEGRELPAAPPRRRRKDSTQ